MRTKASLVTPEDTLPLRPLHALCCWYGSVHHGPSYGQLSGVRSLCRDAVNIYLQCHFVRLIHGTLYMFHHTIFVQYCAAVKHWECPTLRETMDLVHQIVVQEGVTDLVHCWYRRVSVTGSPECCPPPRRATLYSLKPENTKWIKRRFNEYWSTYLSRWLQRRRRPGCISHLGQTWYSGAPFWGRMCSKSKNIICWGEKEESKVSLWCRCKQKTASWC